MLESSNTELQKLRIELSNQKEYRKNHDNPSVRFRWYDDDLGSISVLNPNTNEYFDVETKEEFYHGLTLQLYKCAKELRKKIKEQDGEHIEVDEAVSRARSSLAELSGSKHKIAHQKRIAATQERLERKELEAPFVEGADDFTSRINGMMSKESFEDGYDNDDLNFGDSELLED